MSAVLLSWRYPSRLGWSQFKPVRGVVSDAEVEKTLKKETPPRAGNKFVHFGGILQTAGDRGDRGAV